MHHYYDAPLYYDAPVLLYVDSDDVIEEEYSWSDCDENGGSLELSMDVSTIEEEGILAT